MTLICPAEEPSCRYNVAPTQEVPVVRPGGSGNLEVAMLRWGLVPSWSKDPKAGAALINARAETIMEKPSFKNSFKSRRCIVPANGFYEWKREGKQKLPFYVTRDDRQLLLFAGLYDRWKGPDGAALETFTIITKPAQGEVAGLHDRMPAVVEQGQIAGWLDAATPVESAVKILESEAPRLCLTPVSTCVNKASYDAPDCIVPLTGSR